MTTERGRAPEPIETQAEPDDASDGNNIPAFHLYHRLEFTEYGRLMNGIKRKGQYSDLIPLKKGLNDINRSMAL